MTPSTQSKQVNITHETLARKLSLAGDPTRLAILEVMFDWEQACVSSIAEAVGISVATASYHLNLMADNGYFTRQRDGQSICYELNGTEFIQCLKTLINESAS